MSRKAQNLRKIWEKAGYRVEFLGNRFHGGELMEITIKIEKKDGTAVSFDGEWDALKDLAHRQAFYIMPVDQNGNKLLLINRNLVHGVFNQLMDIRISYMRTYWFIQQADETEDFQERLFRLAFEIKEIKNKTRHMCSNQRRLLRQINCYAAFEAYRRELYDLTDGMVASELLTKEDMQIHLNLARMTGTSD